MGDNTPFNLIEHSRNTSVDSSSDKKSLNKKPDPIAEGSPRESRGGYSEEEKCDEELNLQRKMEIAAEEELKLQTDLQKATLKEAAKKSAAEETKASAAEMRQMEEEIKAQAAALAAAQAEADTIRSTMEANEAKTKLSKLLEVQLKDVSENLAVAEKTARDASQAHKEAEDEKNEVEIDLNIANEKATWNTILKKRRDPKIVGKNDQAGRRTKGRTKENDMRKESKQAVLVKKRGI